MEAVQKRYNKGACFIFMRRSTTCGRDGEILAHYEAITKNISAFAFSAPFVCIGATYGLIVRAVSGKKVLCTRIAVWQAMSRLTHCAALPKTYITVGCRLSSSCFKRHEFRSEHYQARHLHIDKQWISGIILLKAVKRVWATCLRSVMLPPMPVLDLDCRIYWH